MMMGSGFMKSGSESARNNRALLKGKKGDKFQNFDKSYITDTIISKKPLKFKPATPEYLAILRHQLAIERRKSFIRSLVAGIVSTLLIAGLVFLLMIY